MKCKNNAGNEFRMCDTNLMAESEVGRALAAKAENAFGIKSVEQAHTKAPTSTRSVQPAKFSQVPDDGLNT